jgi:uncharacterized protein (TIGR03435 family)
MFARFFVAGLLFMIPLRAQSGPAFEVASIREGKSGGAVLGGCHGINSVYTPAQQAAAPPLGECRIGDARLSHLIGLAYDVNMTNLKTGPDWIQRGDLRFTVQAKAEDASKTTEQELLTMLQNLLIERFQLKFHYETEDISGLSLAVGKNGLKLKPSQSEQTSLRFTAPNGQQTKPVRGQPISITARKASMAMLADLLGQVSSGPVVDKTELTGQYDFTLSWDEGAGPALSTALREQLGLSVSNVKVSVSTLVVDSAEKPSAN